MMRLGRLTRRLVAALGTLVLVSMLTFLATNAVPNDAARVALGRTATPAQIAAYNQQQGLNDPVVARYFTWLGNFATGDWGASTRNRRPVRPEVTSRLARSALVAVVAMALAIPLAFVLGAWLGRRAGTRTDVGASVGLLLINSLPEFVIGLLMLMLFAVGLGWLPVESTGAVFASGFERVEAYILPILTLVLVLTPYMARMLRTNVRETVGHAYVRTAVLRGVPGRRLMWRHVVPNAALPTVNVITLNLAEILGGLVVVETVFGFPGLGQLLVDSVHGKDIPTVQAIALLTALGFVVLNSVADATVAALNPRLRTAD